MKLCWVEVQLAQEVAERTWTLVERIRAEGAVRASEARRAFLLRLSDALQLLADPIEVQGVAARLLGEHPGASRVNYAAIDGDEAVIEREYTQDVPSLLGRNRISSP